MYGCIFGYLGMSEQRLKQLYREMNKAREHIDLLQEGREIELELSNLSADQKVGRGYFFRMEIDGKIEQQERALSKLTREADKLAERLAQENAPDISWRDYAGKVQEQAIEAKDRIMDVGTAARDKVRDVLPQRGDANRTDADRLKEEMDRVVATHFPEIHGKEQDDLKAQKRAMEARERPYQEAAKEHARRDRKEARDNARAEAEVLRSESPPQDDDEQKRALEQRLERINARLHNR